MKKGLLFLIVILIGAFSSNTIFKKPDDLIPKEEMVALLTDLYIATAAKSSRNLDKKRNEDYTFIVFEKYGIDSAQFRRSNYYYTTKIDEYEKIYKKVQENISAINERYKGLKKIKDSIRKDSVTRIRKHFDSIKKFKKDSLELAKKDKANLDSLLGKDDLKPIR